MAQAKLVREKFTFNPSGNAAQRAIGTHVIGRLPAGATLVQAYFDTEVTFTSATDAGTIGVGLVGAVSTFDTAIAISDGSNPWDIGIRKADEPTDQDTSNNSPGPENLSDYHNIGSSSVNVVAVVAVEALLLGKFDLFVSYYID